MYDPATGRFASDDQITDTDNPQQLNGYAYAYNSPITYSDPDGRWGFKSLLHKVAAVASVASIIPGPIGAAAGISAAAYAGAGDWKNAAIMTATIALSMAGAGIVGLAAKGAMVAKGAVVAVKAAKAAKLAKLAATAAPAATRGVRAASKVRGGVYALVTDSG